MGSLLSELRTLAYANRLANHRLHEALLLMLPGEFSAARSGFFPSLRATLNHILIVDWFYIAALHGETDMRAAFVSEIAFTSRTDLVAAQRVADMRLVHWCEAANPAALESIIAMDRGDHFQRDHARHVLMHLFTHQIHHRGQAHAMLWGTSVKPPQLDEFVMPSDAVFRVQDLADLGWTEATLFGKESP